MFFTAIDWAVLLGYFAGIAGLGLFFWAKNRSADDFTAGGRTLPGWLCGLSIFATYLSSISYLALPGKAYVANWNVFVFSLALPIAAAVAVRYFVPIYRRGQEVSAYSLLEKRFGLWARIYASSFYLLYQIARIGVVMYLMALPMAVLFGWDIRRVILVTGVIVTGYSFIGGILAVIWADAIQAVVLLAGALLALAILLAGMPGGIGEVLSVASDDGKFSLGSTSITSLGEPTIWVMFAFGLFENLRNFGVDQSYVQRYIAASSDREAAKSVWIGALLYVPVSALFLFIGSALYAYHQAHPQDQQEVRRIVAQQRLMQEGAVDSDVVDAEVLKSLSDQMTDQDIGDRVFPHFIAAHLPQGARGLLIAAVFAAAMSTVSTSLNSSATLVMCDFYQRLFRRDATDTQNMWVLRFATITWGVLGTLMAFALVRLTDSALDVWWLMSGVLGAAIIGLFFLAIMVPRLSNRGAAVTLILGTILIAWMAVSRSDYWPAQLGFVVSPLHPLLVVAIGPVAMLVVAMIIAMVKPDVSEGHVQSRIDNG